MKGYKVKFTSIRERILENKREAVLLLAVLLLAAALRLWKIDGYLTFLGDEGRDVRVVRRFLTDFDLMFVGPRTSIGDMYLGPLYYYLIAPFLALWRFSPVGPATFVALLSVATVFLTWFAAREWFGKVAAFFASLLFAISPVVILHARHSWNPNIMPFFALLSIFAIWRVWQKREWKWLLVLGVSFAAVLQSHYLGLLLLPTIGIFWLLTLRNTQYAIRSQALLTRSQALLIRKKFFIFSLFAFSLFAFSMSPLVFFDAKHAFRNWGAMVKFFTERQTTVSARPWNAIPDLWPLWQNDVVTNLLVGREKEWSALVAIVLVIGALWLGRKWHNNQKKVQLAALRLTSLWIVVGLLGLGLYKQAIYSHYFEFMFAAPFLLVGAILQELWTDRKWLVIVIGILLIWINLQQNPLKDPPQRQLQRVQEIDRRIMNEAGDKPFNFGLIAKRNYEEGYLYFFELWKAPVREIDAQRSKETITDQLFVVCEDTTSPGNPEPCKPINHEKAEIANFGWAKIEKEWEQKGVRVFKLVHNPEGQ
ncbi:MAG: glycosyltransferase family 39 protein [Candidatus Blackburnbacteria bacterium]|nr:glycosyltransferase family 39 protein [Candidatus Blackburnbacteria bacterium]